MARSNVGVRDMGPIPWYRQGVSQLFPRLAFPDDRLALSFDGSTTGYRALAHRASAHVAELRSAGLAAGDRVGVFTHGCIDTAVAIVGNALAGFVTVPINPKLGSKELAHILADSAPRRLVAAASHVGEHPGLEVRPIAIGSAVDAPPERLVDDAPLLVLYTSGTTGAPKGAVITARNVAANIDGLAAAWGWTDADAVVHALPLFHVHGLVLGLFGSLRVGGALVHVARFTPEALAEALAREGTMLFAVPTMYHRLVEVGEGDPAIASALRGARLLVSGSAPLSVREHRRIEALTGRGVHERYGLTETLIDCAVPASSSPRPGYVGPAVSGVEVRLVDDEGRPFETSDDVTIGEVVVRGPSVFAGYLNRPEATAAVFDAEGFFHTGDLATRASDGSIRIVGRRATDLIKTGGFKVGAGEIEASLLEHPAVLECAVVGAPDPDLGERIVAFVVVRPGVAAPDEKELVDHVASDLSPHKRPRAIRFVADLPRNAMGKVTKKALVASLEG